MEFLNSCEGQLRTLGITAKGDLTADESDCLPKLLEENVLNYVTSPIHMHVNRINSTTELY